MSFQAGRVDKFAANRIDTKTLEKLKLMNEGNVPWHSRILFVWDEGKYTVNAPLKETVPSIQSQVAKIEDDMKMFCISLSLLREKRNLEKKSFH